MPFRLFVTSVKTTQAYEFANTYFDQITGLKITHTRGDPKITGLQQ